MSLYNILYISLSCPRCGERVDTTVECKFGYVNEMRELMIGDRYPWRVRAQPQNGGRPKGGNVDGDGYMECPRCNKDSFLRVIVREDVICDVEPNGKKPGYVPG